MSFMVNNANTNTTSAIYPTASLKSELINGCTREQLISLAECEFENLEKSRLDNKRTLGDHCDVSDENFYKAYNSSSANSYETSAVMEKCKSKFIITKNGHCKFEEQICKYTALLCDFNFISSLLFFVENTTITAFITLDEICVEKTAQIAYAVVDYELSADNCHFEHVYFENGEISDEEASQAIIVFSKKS